MGRSSDSTVSLTKTFIENAPAPAAGRTYFYDAKQPGFALAVTSTGAKSFYVVKGLHGRCVRVKIGSAADLTPEQARRRAAAMMVDLADGKDPRQQRREARRGESIRQLFDRWQEINGPRKRPKSNAQESWLFKKHVEPTLGSRRVKDVRRADLIAMHHAVGKNHGHYVANRAVGMVGTILQHALIEGTVEVNVARGVKKFKETSRDRFLKPDELRRFLQCVASDPDEVFSHFILMALLTGARRSNLEQMQWKDIDEARCLWRIPGTESKNGEPMLVVLPPQAMVILKRRREAQAATPREYVFNAKQRTCNHIQNHRDRWLRLLKRADLKNVRLHDVRRTMGSWLAIGGTSMPIIGRALGHRHLEATQVYARLSVDPVRDAVDRTATTMLGFAEIDVIGMATSSKKGIANGTEARQPQSTPIIIDAEDPQADQPKAGRKRKAKAAAGG